MWNESWTGISQGEEKTNLSFLFLSQSSSSVTRSGLTFGKNKEVQIFHSIRPSDKVLEIESVPIHVASFLGISLVINSIDRQAKQALGDRRRPLCLTVCVYFYVTLTELLFLLEYDGSE